MIKVENYPSAFKEVYVILNSMSKEDVDKIPSDFMDMIKNNMDDEYEFELYDDISFEEQFLLQETKAILAHIFLNYWGTEEQNAKIKAKFEQDLREEEESKGKYNPDELFKKKKDIFNEKKIEEVNSKEKNVQLVEYKEKGFWVKMIDSIKRLFKK